MLRSMFSAVSGLRGHQSMLDVIGNNLANVNTVGYKGSSVIFQDLLSQQLRGAGAGTALRAGTNPAQVGIGVRLGAITQTFTQGAAQLTNRATDISIQGDGFFTLRTGGEFLYTRLGSFSFDDLGRLSTPEGGILQGWMATNGVLNTNAPVGDLRLPLGQIIEPVQTSTLRLGGNLPSDAATGTAVTTSIDVHDTQGTAIPMTFTFTKTATANEWTVAVTAPDSAGVATPVDEYDPPVTLTFNPSTGFPTAPLPTIDRTQLGTDLGRTFDAGTITIDAGAATDPDALRQFAGSNSVAAISQDGNAMGFLRSFTIGADGSIVGVFSNGTTQILGQLSLTTFNNPAGLDKAGDSTYRATINSGLPNTGMPGDGGRGTLLGGTLEMSNIDVANEFTNLIVAQRGFQANSRVITSSDELLQDVISMKR